MKDWVKRKLNKLRLWLLSKLGGVDRIFVKNFVQDHLQAINGLTIKDMEMIAYCELTNGAVVIGDYVRIDNCDSFDTVYVSPWSRNASISNSRFFLSPYTRTSAGLEATHD